MVKLYEKESTHLTKITYSSLCVCCKVIDVVDMGEKHSSAAVSLKIKAIKGLLFIALV